MHPAALLGVVGILDEFERHLASMKRSPHTVRQYLFLTRQLLEHYGGNPANLRAEDLEGFRQYLALERNYARASLMQAVGAMRAFATFLGSNAAEGLRAPRRRRSLPHFLSVAEVGALLQATEAHPRDHALLSLLAYTGLRVSEACGLDLDDVDLRDRNIRVLGKGEKERLVVFSESCSDTLRAWLMVRGVQANAAMFIGRGGDRLSTRSVQRMIKKWAYVAGLAADRVTPHVLRHSLATALLGGGADIRFIQQLLGHASIATTQVYTHVDLPGLRRVYESALPEFAPST